MNVYDERIRDLLYRAKLCLEFAGIADELVKEINAALVKKCEDCGAPEGDPHNSVCPMNAPPILHPLHPLQAAFNKFDAMLVAARASAVITISLRDKGQK